MNLFKYSVIRIEPDIRRGERVNVGLVVFHEKKLDIRVVETRKASAIASNDWDPYIQSFASELREIQAYSETPEETVATVSNVSKQIILTNPGWFEVRGDLDYETEVKRILTDLVKRPTRKRPQQKENSISKEIATSFRNAQILSKHGEDLSSGKVVRNYLIDHEVGLEADFALKNGCLHIATTLNLTSNNPHIGSAASKAITLDLAKKANPNTKTYGVYAVTPSRKSEVSEHIALLGDYSSDIYNWLDSHDQTRFKRAFFDAYSSNFPNSLEERMQ